MRSPNPHQHPLGPDAPTEDYVGLAFAGLAVGISTGTGIAALSGFVVRTLQGAAPPATALDLSAPPAMALFLGTLVAIVSAAVVTWRILAPAQSPYRQGTLAMVSAFATIVVSLVTMPVDRALGPFGLLGLAAVALALAVFLHRRYGHPPEAG
jgi:hypothetical protein